MGESGRHTTQIIREKCPEHERCFGAIIAKLDAILSHVAKHSGSLKMDQYRLNLHEKVIFGGIGAVLTAFMAGLIYLVFKTN